MDRLGAIETFVRVADAGSFNRAATLQGTTPQAVSKAVRQLERALGLRLFNRSTRRSSLTDEGKAFLQQVRPGLDQIAQAWTGARELTAEQAGLIRIAAPRLVGNHLLVPLVGEWRARHPRVEFELLLDDDYTDLVSTGVHLGFRAGQPPDRQLVVRELFRMQLIVCAAPSYLRQRGVPTTVEELRQHACTGSRQPRTGRVEPWEFVEHGELRLQDIHSPLYTNDFETETRAVRAGIGIGQLDSISTADLLRRGELVPLLCDQVNDRHGLYLYYRPRKDLPVRVRLFIDFVLDRLLGGAEFRFRAGELEALHRQGTGGATARQSARRRRPSTR